MTWSHVLYTPNQRSVCPKREASPPKGVSRTMFVKGYKYGLHTMETNSLEDEMSFRVIGYKLLGTSCQGAVGVVPKWIPNNN